MSEKNDFIQLPPIKKDTSSDVVAFIWEYMKISENSREKVKDLIKDVHENGVKLEYKAPKLYEVIPKGEIAEFFKNNAMEIKEELSTFANYYRGEKEGYQVRCSAKEKEVPLIELTMTVPTKAAAEAVCASWQTKNKAVYEKLLDMLM